jgi:hypothetical protein
MTRHDEQDIIGTRRKAPVDWGPLFGSGSANPPGSGETSPGAHIGTPVTSPRPRPGQRRQDMPMPGRVQDALIWHARKHEREIATVAPLLRGLAKERGSRGVNCTDTRKLAIAAGCCTGTEGGRALSWFANVPRRAGLVSAGLDDAWTGTGNRPTKYLHPDFAGGASPALHTELR